MEHLKHENDALRRELIALVQIAEPMNHLLKMLYNNHKDALDKDDLVYIKMVIEASNHQLNKLKTLQDEK